ncbi:MAG TPA: SCP2 sterol-binding domain-containing protein [Pseudogracilibacillus sp.]|nr:SCP2 sterol-binding domain-containing protein [Pseudogracilibacillus sp.]
MDIQSLSIDEIWEEVRNKAVENPSLIEGLNHAYQFDIKVSEGEQSYTLSFDDGVNVVEGRDDEADCLLQMNEKNFKKLVEGSINSAAAFMTGKLKVKGNIGLALKLESALKKFSWE